MARVIPIIHVDDIDAALDFYTGVLECELDFVGRDDDSVSRSMTRSVITSASQ